MEGASAVRGARWGPVVIVDVRGVLLDIDGVLVVSWEQIPGAVDSVAALQAAGLPVRHVTNTTSRPRAAIAGALRGAGFVVEDHEVLTAPLATASYLRREHPDARCFLVNSGDLGDDLAGIDWVDGDDGAEVVVLGGAGPEFGYERLNRAFALLLDGAALVAMHRNLYWRTSAGMELDTGAYVAALEAAAGREAVVVGKPAEQFFVEAVGELGVPAGQVVMVGDDLHSDVLGAQAAGLHGVLVRTGKYRAEEVAAAEAAGEGTPDHTIESIADLPELLGIT